MSKIRNINSGNKNNDGGKQPKESPEPADLSKLEDGVYPLKILAAAFVKHQNRGRIVVRFGFHQEELSRTLIDASIADLNFGGNIIVPGVKPSGPIVPGNHG